MRVSSEVRAVGFILIYDGRRAAQRIAISRNTPTPRHPGMVSALSGALGDPGRRFTLPPAWTGGALALRRLIGNRQHRKSRVRVGRCIANYEAAVSHSALGSRVIRSARA